MQVDEEKLMSFVDRAVGDLAAGYGGVMISLGRQLGLYKTMAGAGPLTSGDLAARSGCSERYVREWLNSQAAGGYIAYYPSSQTYELTPEQAVVLADEESPYFIPPAWEVPASMWFDLEMAIRAFRTGEGVQWSSHNERLFCGSAAFYRNSYRGQLVQHWLPALDGVITRLTEGISVADVGCGYGHSTLIMAEAFPKSSFYGFDSHEASINVARENARKAAADGRLSFEVAGAADYDTRNFDLICFFDCLHDMGNPVAAALHARKALADDGTLMVVEPFANDRVEDNFGPVGRLYYAASTTICCAHSLSEEGGLALGAQAGEARLAQVFAQAGFRRLRRALDTPFNMILEVRP